MNDMKNDTSVSNPMKVDAMNEKLRTQDNVNAAIAKDGHFYAHYAGPNYLFNMMDHVCAYEYCIETQPLHPGANGQMSCPIFGHDCPGGAWQAFFCRMNDDRPHRHEYTPMFEEPENDDCVSA